MSTNVARTGRQSQRYEDNFRLVSGNGLIDSRSNSFWELSVPVRWSQSRPVTKIQGDSLGDWTSRSKSKQEICSLEGGCKVHMFALEVTEELDAWPEQENHDRKWLSIKEAFQLCRYERMSAALEKFLEVMATDKKAETSRDVMELNPATVSDIVSERPIMSTNCLPSLLSQKKTVFQPFKCPAPQC